MSKYKIEFAPVDFSDAIKYVEEVLKSGWLTSGKFVNLVEERLSDYFKRPFLLTSSCTHSLELAYKFAIEKTEKNLFVVPTWTFAATANAAVNVGGRIAFYDVDDNLSVDFKSLARILQKHGNDVAAVVTVDYSGLPVDYKKVRHYIDMYAPQALFIADCAHSFGSSYLNEPAGFFADIACFSFYANKNLPAGEGGGVLIKSEWERDFRLMRLHGISKDSWARYGSGKWDYSIEIIGKKANMSDLHAAVLMAKLERFDEDQKIRLAYWAKYAEVVEGIEGVRMLPLSIGVRRGNAHLAVLLFEDINRRDSVMQCLVDAGVMLSFHFPPLHIQPAYTSEMFGVEVVESFGSIAEYYSNRVFSLPISAYLEPEDVDYVCENLYRCLHT